MDYLSPAHSKGRLNSFVLVSDFGIVILVKGKYFVKANNWYSVELEDPEAPEIEKKLPFNREYFVIPYTLIDDISHDMAEKILTITTKVIFIRICVEFGFMWLRIRMALWIKLFKKVALPIRITSVFIEH